MGRSKFPGKPSKLVTKKRVSVLNGSNATATGSNANSSITSNSLTDSNNDIEDGDIELNYVATAAAATTEQQQLNVEAGSDIALRSTTTVTTAPTANTALQTNITKDTQSPDRSAPKSNDQSPHDSNATDSSSTTVDGGKKATKKKRVSFKFALETSDDVHIVKKEPNATFAPPVPIIKKECLTRAIRIARGGESIIMPSRLTGLTQKFRNNSANNIDKLNSLTFKSQNVKSSKQTSEDNDNGENDDDDDEDDENVDDNGKDSDDGSDCEDEHRKNTDACSTDSEQNVDEIADKSDENDSDGNKEVDDNVGLNGKTAVGEKRFVLPKRSVHSCRVIKPNKRFLDESQSATGKNGITRKKASKAEAAESSAKAEAFSAKIPVDQTDRDTNNDDEEGLTLKMSNNIKNNPFAKISDDSSIAISSSKTILRQSRLQFTSSLNTKAAAATVAITTVPSNKEGMFSSSLSNCNLNRSSIQLSNSVCGVCATVSPAAFTHQSRKYGISSCEACRKFISKSIKKLDVCSEKSPPNVLQCKKNDGNCAILPIVRTIRSLKASIKERCPACWLKKCIVSYRLPSEMRTRIVAILPSNMRNIDNKSFMSSSFQIKSETANSSDSTLTLSGMSNLFSNSLSACRRMMPSTWSAKETVDNGEFRLFNSLTNPLAENNVKFGSSLQIVPNILEKASIMTAVTSSSSNDSSSIKKMQESKETKPLVSPKDTPASAIAVKKSPTTNPCTEVEESIRLRSRKKERNETTTTTTASITASTITPPLTSTSSVDVTKRQRIDLKGPRVKHVCRSASIVLGQPIATFADENPILDTPPRPESPNGIVEFEEPPASIIASQNDKQNDQQKAFSFNECADSTRLSPPATPIINDYDSESTMKEQPGEKSPSDVSKSDDTSIGSVDSIRRTDESKPVTRKLTRPGAVSSNNTTSSVNNKKLNSFIRKPPPQKAVVKTPPMISTDFWENYDPAEVSQTGFGLIFSEEVPLKALCFLCGSCGQEPLIFCVCCCEPYHQYCVEDEYNLKQHISLDDTNVSFMESSFIGGVGGSNSLTSSTNKLNWLCPRCTICYTCNMASGSKVKCQKCQKNYHSTCLGTSKRLLGADRPLICASCLKCKSCGTTTVSKFVGNLPMCSQCFKLRQKGNYCPLCQKCYEDNDFNIKMMECGDCHRWVHSKCEGLTDEQYNMLSVLPENIEFICKKCAKINPMATTWREAVSAEFKAGLLGVVKLLSKSRQACALLKLSPRKKPAGCRVCIQTSLRMIPMARDDNELEGKTDDPFDFATSHTTELNTYQTKCYCSASLPSQKQNTSQSLLDIKQKILANKYYSLADFNYDMNVVISDAACDELMTTYKEILSEAFPWFQNETKACTDALEEDMYDSCNFGQGSLDNEVIDQQVPMVDVPEDIDEYFYQPGPTNDTRSCMFCKGTGDGISTHESRLLYCGQNAWVHTNCAMWSAEVFEEIDGSLQNVHSAISRGRMIKCSECGNKGATVGCNVRNCGEHYHFPCARNTNCSFMSDKTVFCPQHSNEVSSDGKTTVETNFEVLRPVYVELDRKRKRPVSPKKVQFLIGSLHVKQLGRFVAKLSDRPDAIVPAEFLCSRLYWSSKEPWKIVEYSIRTSIQSNSNVAMDTGRNFTVDHSNNLNKVQIGLAQISKWHSSLLNGDDYENFLRQERSIKLLTGHNEETNEEEPQSNADLLPPEIKDAIFEDLPHDILDGISMLDIFPKLMTYEDMVAMDTKTETLMNADMLRDNCTDDDASQNSQKCFDADNWANTNMHVEDAMLSARSAAGVLSRDLKRNKSDLFARGGFGNRGFQRTSNMTWNNKLDPAISAKRRKMSRFDLRLPEGVLLSLGRSKDEISNNISEITRQCLQSEEMKSKSFTWSAAKRFVQLNNDSQPQDNNGAAKNRFKISQLDGMDDVGSEIGSSNNDFRHLNTISFNGREAPVKCDRCHCTYRTHESYRRHLQSCEPLSSTSESDSDANSKSPEIQNQQSTQSNVILTAMNGQDYCNIPIIQQNNHQSQQIFGLSGANLNQLGMQNSVQIHNGQSLPITSLQNGSLPVQMQGMFINPSAATIQPQHQQSHVFAQPLTLGALQQSVFPIQNLGQNANNQAQTISLQHATSQNIQYQPQIFTYSTANTSQVLTVTPSQQQNIATSYASIKTIQNQTQFNKNPMILPQVDKITGAKKQPIAKLPMSPNRNKGRTSNTTKAIQMKKPNAIKSDASKPVTQMTNNSNMANIRPASAHLDNNIVIQPAPAQTSSQPIIVQQVAAPNQGNILQYVTTSDANNGMQYFALPTNDFKPQQTAQYLTPNPLIPGTFQLQTDNGNLLLANTASGLQVIPNGALQLAQQQQPQVIGTLIQPQATTIQCGMMSSEQMMLGATPQFEMVANPLPGCMLLNSQPVYYGLETIVQNTVMQSQQFVSTAMQGVLSQNSSFSATTTQVFQASKIEPIMDMQPSYVVLNNDGTIMTPQAQQPLIATTNLLQQTLPQLQTQTAQVQQSQSPAWRFIDDKSTVFASNQNTGILQTQAQQPQQQQIQPNQHQTFTLTPQQQQQHQQHQQVPSIQPQSIQLQKVQPQKQPPKQRQPKQTLSQKPIVKPTVKSSPIVVTELQQMKKISAFENETKQPLIFPSKPTTEAFIVSKTIDSLAKTELNNSKVQMITTSSANEMKMSTKITSSLSQPVQRKVNTTKPIGNGTKVTSASIKPKILNKPLLASAKQQNIIPALPKAHLTSDSISTLTTSTPLQTITITAAMPMNPKQQEQSDFQKSISIPMYQQSPGSAPLINNGASMQQVLNDTKTPICAFDNGIPHADRECALRKNIPNLGVKVPTDSSTAASPQQTSINSIASNQYQQEQQQLLPTTQSTVNSSIGSDNQKSLQTQFNSGASNQAHINLPTSNCIQLPTAPYAPLYANGIPTNVVNPIQQYTHNNTRPTNRVLPMQTIQPKNISFNEIEAVESKPIDIKLDLAKKASEDEQTKFKDNKLTPTSSLVKSPPDDKFNDDRIKFEQVDSEATDVFENERKPDFKLEKMDEDMGIGNDVDENSSSTDLDTFKDSFLRATAAEEAFDKLKNEETHLMLNGVELDTENATCDVKEKISKIIDNFENDDKHDELDAQDLFDLPETANAVVAAAAAAVAAVENQNGQLPSEEMLDQKENLNPTDNPILENAPSVKLQKLVKDYVTPRSSGPKLLYEIQSQDGFTYKSTSITEIWEKLFEAVQIARKAHGLSPLPVGPLADMCGHQMMGLKTNALKYLLEQLPGVERCSNYMPVYHKRAESTVSQTSSSGYWSDCEELKENINGTARCERYKGRSEYDMFSWLASRHRKQPIQICVAQNSADTENLVRRGSGSNLPMAMRYRTLKETYKDSVGVYRSHIHGRGLFCNRDIEAGEMVIEYAGELIRSTLTDKRERYYDGRGIGCYMFKIDDNLVVDATMRGNAARFINHSCEPNCYSKVVDILGHKHIIIFALRRIVQGEELTYDYKFPFEETKIPCSCGSRKCRKYLN